MATETSAARRSDIDRPGSRSLQPERPKSRRGATFQEEIEKARMRPPTSAPKTYNTYIGTGTAIFQPDKIPVGLQPQFRNVSQARLSTGRIVRQQPERMVRDKKYYEGLLRAKLNKLSSELISMSNEMERSAKELSSFNYLKTMVKELASSLTELQGRLADHNLAIQKVNIGSDPGKTLAEARELSSRNSAEENALEILFTDRIRRQEALAEMQNQLNKEKYKTDQMIANMNANMKQNYNDMMKYKSDMQMKVAELQKQIDVTMKSISAYSDQVYVSPPKLEAFENEIKIWDLQNKEETMIAENKGLLKPEEEYASMLNKIKQDNLHMAVMEKSISEIFDQIKESEMQLVQLADKKVDDTRNLRHTKYLELRKKVSAMDEFLSTVEEHREDELNKLKALDSQILPLLKTLSTHLATVPTAADYKTLSASQTHVIKSDLLNTVKSIGIEHKNLLVYMKKIAFMDTKLQEDLNCLQEKIITMTNGIETFSNTDDLEAKINIRKHELTQEKQKLTKVRPETKANLKETTDAFNIIQKQLTESEIYAQVLFMEKRLQSLSQSNFVIKEYLEETKTEENIEKRKAQVLENIKRLNEKYKNTT